LVTRAIRALARALDRKNRGRPARQAGRTTSALPLHSVVSNPVAYEALREHLKTRQGGENLEFLLAYWHLNSARNPLQRFQQLRHIIHVFVRDNAERSVALSHRCRNELLREWSGWSAESRFPVDSQIPALDAAATEIHEFVATQTELASWVGASPGHH
jgi:hypothetical protein